MKLKIFIALMLLSGIVNAQTDDISRIALNTYISSSLRLSDESRSLIENKLNQITSNYGLGGNQYNPRFIITANVIVTSKDIVAGPPQMIAQNIDVTFYIGDGIDNIRFSSLNVSVMGVGTNENKSFIDAINNIETKSKQIQKFIDDGKYKIVNYYTSKCDLTLKNAENLVSQGKYDEAIYNLSLVPNVCSNCYSKCQGKISEYYQQKIDADCIQKLNTAQGIWYSSQNYSGADRAGNILLAINPTASCIQDVQSFLKVIRDKIESDERAAWELKVKQFEEQIKRENQMIEYAREDAARKHELSKIRTEAIKNVAIEFAKNLPDVINNIAYNRILWW